jgi:hypothetical protein
MACPYFQPVEPHPGGGLETAMLPLGDFWSGTCQVSPGEPWHTEAAGAGRMCNMGYARGACGCFPEGDGPDAVRFSVASDDGCELGVRFAVERGHLPFAHGWLHYSLALGVFAAVAQGGPEGAPPAVEMLSGRLNACPTSALLRLAEAYVQSYLRRK